MKKVRFETPTRGFCDRMEERECHSPRPFMQMLPSVPSYVQVFHPFERVVAFSNDPVERYETSDSSPYPKTSKTQLPNTCVKNSSWNPSNELDLSMLDASSQSPRQPLCRPLGYSKAAFTTNHSTQPPVLPPFQNFNQKPQVVKENVVPSNVLSKENSFFITKDNVDKCHMATNGLYNLPNKYHLGNEKNPVAKSKMSIGLNAMSPIEPQKVTPPQLNLEDSACRCHHCVKSPQHHVCESYQTSRSPSHQQYLCSHPPVCHQCSPAPIIQKTCHCTHSQTATPSEKNAVDKKTWAIEKFEKSKNGECLEMSRQTNVLKDKREPTVADLFKIIKLQNEQLQLLQDKVDKFISSNNSRTSQNAPSLPVQNYVTEHVALQTIDNEEHKISIGVMTSFEMVHTSTIINKEVLTHRTENAQIQCNRSQISIKEVVSKPCNFNILDGLEPNRSVTPESASNDENDEAEMNGMQQTENDNDEKTLNEISLYNVQLDNATTPHISPDQTMYLDVRDYSDSESSGNTSPVEWTYYNQVMTRMNGLIQESEMPSSASAMYRNTRQQFRQMQIDKTNVSVTKRVKFGDDIHGIHQSPIYSVPTDTSLKMNQLAAKYLNVVPAKAPEPKPVVVMTRPPAPIDMSIATRNYMERHKLLQGSPISPPSREAGDMPRFLDMTAIKRQTKLL